MIRLVPAIFLSATRVLCQSPSVPTFDVASIKVNPPARVDANPIFGENIRATPGSLTMNQVTLKACIQWAYHVFEYQVSGPDWIGSQHYDIVARAAGPAKESELRVMLQALLADRFQLAFHRQTKEMQAYVLSVGKNGPKFHEPATEGDSSLQPDPKTMSVRVQNTLISQIVDPLSRVFQMPVIDRTGLTGRYDVSINVAKYIPASGERVDPVEVIRTALEQELGLKLEARRMALDLLIVDHATRSPAEN